MSDLNIVVLQGRLGANPEMRYTPNGKAVTTFSIGVNRFFKSGDGEPVQKTDWIRITTWGQLAENCNAYLAKGREVTVQGRLQKETWKAQDGSNRSRTSVVATFVRFGPKPGATTDEGESEDIEFVEGEEELPF